MSFLEEYDAIDPSQPTQQMGLFLKYVLTDADTMFAELRAHRPIFVMPAATLVTRFVDVQEILTRPKVFSVRLYQPKMDPSVGPFMLARDGTTINRRDKSIMTAMLRLEDLPAVRKLVSDLADAAIQASKGTIEVVSQLSRLVPVQLTGKYFGFPGPDVPTMMRWSRATQYDMFHNTPQNDPKIHADNVQAGTEAKAYLAQLVRQRRAELKADPSLDDTLSRLLKTVLPEVIGFDEERVIANTIGLLVGGVETTSAAIVQALDELLERPAQFEAARGAAAAGNDDLLAQYVWEALRFHPINPFVVRFCEQDYMLADDTDRKSLVKTGTVVLASARSGMMDDGEIDTPEEFRLGRPDYQNMHFGYGYHTCLGDQVSLVQIPAIIQRLLLCKNLRRAAGPDGQVDFQGGPFPEKFVLQFGV
jgi:cytochrome P450